MSAPAAMRVYIATARRAHLVPIVRYHLDPADTQALCLLREPDWRGGSAQEADKAKHMPLCANCAKVQEAWIRYWKTDFNRGWFVHRDLAA